MLSQSIRVMARGGLPLALYTLLAAAFVSSQDISSSAVVTSAPSSASSAAASSGTASSTSKTPITHTVDVAKGGFTFVPDVIQAEVGDTVQFSFFPTNHSVVRAEYKYPCIPYELTGVDKVGFFSGFKPVDAILNNPPVFNLLINDTLPIFYYCSAPGSCINYAMVGVINPNSTVSLAVQKQDAKSSEYMLEPGQNFPDEGSNPLASSSSVPSSTSSTSSMSMTMTSAAATSTTSAAAATASKSGGLSTGAIAGIAVGAAVVGLMVAALFFLWIRNKALNKRVKETDTVHQMPPAGPEASERGSYFYGAPPSHISGAYSAQKESNDRTSYVSSAYSPGLPQYAPPPPIPSPTLRHANVPTDGVPNDGQPSPGPASPLVRPQSPPERTFTGFSTPPQEVSEKPASGPHELAASISRATKRLSGRTSGRSSAQA